jgi:non-ribosomal peptide synthetase component F
VVNGAIHRIIEQQAAMQPDAAALVDGGGRVTYRELNVRANTLARRLADSGLTRGTLALVRMERGVDLATVLLAVLKAGAAYTWVAPGSPDDVELPANFCIAPRTSGVEQRYLALDIRNALTACAARPSPNLPILTRGSDAALVVRAANGEAQVVPHESVTSMGGSGAGAWTSESGAFDLWIGLMSGEALTIGRRDATGDPAPASGIEAATQAA